MTNKKISFLMYFVLFIATLTVSSVLVVFSAINSEFISPFRVKFKSSDIKNGLALHSLINNSEETSIENIIFDYYDYDTESNPIYLDNNNVNIIENKEFSTIQWGIDEQAIEVNVYRLPDSKNTETILFLSHDTIYACEDMSNSFSNMSNLKSIVFDNFNTSNTTNLSYMFSDCSSLRELNISNFNTTNTTNMTNIFSNCSALETLTIGTNFGVGIGSSLNATYIGLNTVASGWTKASDNSEVTNDQLLISGADTYTANAIYCFSTYNKTTQTLRLYQRRIVPQLNQTFNDGSSTYYVNNIYSWRLENTKDKYTTCIGGRPPRDNNGNILGNWTNITSNPNSTIVTEVSSVIAVDIIKPQSLHSWFREFRNCNNFNLKNLDTSDAESMSYMFFDANKPLHYDLTNFNTSKVTSMSYMFSKCWDLQTVDLSSFDTSNVTSMEGMFDMTTATNLSSKLTTIYVSDKFVTTNVKKSSKMFHLCNKLVGGNTTNPTTLQTTGNIVDKTYAVIDKEGQPGYFTEKTSL